MSGAEFKVVLEHGLEQAAMNHFCQLFAVLMVKPDKVAWDRFNAGIDKLAATHSTMMAKIGEMP